MKIYFYFGILGLILFEVLNVFFIMPMPGSQEINSLDLAYFLYTHRWLFRAFFLLMIIVGIANSFQSKRKRIPIFCILILAVVIYLFNYKMGADKMFLQPKQVIFASKTKNKLPLNSLVLGVEFNGTAKAYPIRFLTFHHQVQDIISGVPILVTYCSVCRTGRVYEPVVNKNYEKFRLVGMDHFNAMFEDETTKSWWRQSTGEAVAGTLTGQILPEVPSFQLSLEKWFQLYPQGLVMQADESSKMYYDSLGRYEMGHSKSQLTRTDSLSWKKKSWVIGVEINKNAKAYDWQKLKKDKIINDKVGTVPVLIALANDGQSFVAFERPGSSNFAIKNDTLYNGTDKYDFAGRQLNMQGVRLKRINAYQEFWHSWSTFHPNTLIGEK